MSDFLILGTDTDAGKSTFCLLWLAIFAERFDYWKPVETGPSDSQRIGAMTAAVVHPPLRSFRRPVAPLLAAQEEGGDIPSAAEIATLRPKTDRALLIESFGGPFSPLNADELQIELIRELKGRAVLVSSSAVGAVGRTIQCLDALSPYAVHPLVVLLGPIDAFAEEQIRRHRDVQVFSLTAPATWDATGVRTAAEEQIAVLRAIESSPLAPVLRGEGSGVRGLASRQDGVTELASVSSPHPQPLSPEYRGEGSNAVAPVLRGEGSKAGIVERDRTFVWHPYTSLGDADPPLACVGAQDEFLTLADGRRVIDGISSWWTILHGHRFPPLMSALRDAMNRFDHVHFAGVTHEPAVKLAELLLSTAHWQGGRVFYSDNGSTAVEVALKLAYQYWRHRGEAQRTCFIGFENGYHGDTFGAMAVGRDPLFFGHFEPLLFKAEIVPLDVNRLAESLRRLKGEVAGVILEPLVQGAGGMRMHSPETLRQIVDITREHDVLFIADEVMTGGGRTGTLWAHQAANVVPDLICAAKTLTGGILPLAATLVAPKVVAAFESADRTRTFFHGHSFTAHPLACSVAAANWRTLTSQADGNPARIERFWQESLAPLRELPGVRDVRIRGSIAAVEVVATGGYLAEIGRHMREACLARGVLLRPLGNVLYALPPLRTSRRSLEQIAAAMTDAVTE